MRLRTAFLDQAGHCAALGSPFMARLMTLLAQGLPRDTALFSLYEAWPGDLGPTAASLPLRLAGGLHALVLNGQDTALASIYPPNAPDDKTFEREITKAITRNDAFLCDWVKNAPQTNEVRRAAVLIAASHMLDHRYNLPLVVSELGASGGLNLMFDQFSLVVSDQTFGRVGAPVTLTPEWRGVCPVLMAPRIQERRGVDINPLDPSNPHDALRLLAYLWADQPDRIARTRAAIDTARATVDADDAIAWLEKRLAERHSNALHLVYHTIAWQYFPADLQQRGRKLIETAGQSATKDTPLAWLSMEADGDTPGAALTLRLWPGDITLALGRADFHGRWVVWAMHTLLT